MVLKSVFSSLFSRPRSPAWPLFPCPSSRRISWLLCSSGFRFQYPRHFVGGGCGGVFLEIAGHDKDGIAHADFRHTVRAAGGAGVVLLVDVYKRQEYGSSGFLLPETVPPGISAGAWAFLPFPAASSPHRKFQSPVPVVRRLLSFPAQDVYKRQIDT